MPITRCLLLPEKLQNAPDSLRGALRYICRDKSNAPVRVGIRSSAVSRDVEVALWSRPSGFPRALATRVLSQAVKNTSLVRVLFDSQLAARDVRKVEVLGGKGFWQESINNLAMRLSAPSFFQVNTSGAETLVSLVVAALEQIGAHTQDRVLDLYCGAGTFTLPLAEHFADVSAVESVGSSLADLRRNLDNAGLDADVVGGDVARELPGLLPARFAVVDPPRSGLSEPTRTALAESGLRGIAYVSCDPATLARDLLALGQAGYSLVGATPVDLFPQSYHVETVAVLERR
jgi:23S rRNA (uracil1939-C5)-methyltransferase